MVVDAFLMRAADDAVGHGDGQHAVPRHDPKHPLSDRPCAASANSGASMRTSGGAEQLTRRPHAAQEWENQRVETNFHAPFWRGVALSRLQGVDQDLGGRTGDQEAVLDRVDTPVLDLGIGRAEAK